MSDLTGAIWHKSSRSGGQAECVEVADNLVGVVGVRDSKDRNGGTLIFGATTWAAFLNEVKAGRFQG